MKGSAKVESASSGAKVQLCNPFVESRCCSVSTVAIGIQNSHSKKLTYLSQEGVAFASPRNIHQEAWPCPSTPYTLQQSGAKPTGVAGKRSRGNYKKDAMPPKQWKDKQERDW